MLADGSRVAEQAEPQLEKRNWSGPSGRNRSALSEYDVSDKDFVLRRVLVVEHQNCHTATMYLK